MMKYHSLIVPNNKKKIIILSLEELKKQFENGEMSEEEYSQKKAAIMDTI